MTKTEPTLRAKFRILILGVVLPLACALWFYQKFTSLYWYSMFRQAAARADFIQEFQRDPDFKKNKMDLVVLGDTAANSALSPTHLPTLKTVVLGINGGSALTSYHILRSYLDERPAPRCVLLLRQQDWMRDYRLFFRR